MESEGFSETVSIKQQAVLRKFTVCAVSQAVLDMDRQSR